MFNPILHQRARDVILQTQSASIARLQSHLRLGYSLACDLMASFEGDLVTPPRANGHRAILPKVLDHTHRQHPNNTYWVVPDSLMAGEYPGDPDPDVAKRKLSCLLKQGLSAFLDLTEAGELLPYEPMLAELAQQAGVDVRYRRMPIRDVDVPDQPQEMRNILNQVEQWRFEHRRVYVHCWGGVGRTGTVVGCYLVDDGMPGEVALDHIRLLWTRMSADKQRRKPQSPETADQCAYVLRWHELSEIL